MRRGRPALAVLACVTVALAGCSGSSTPKPSPTPGTPTGSPTPSTDPAGSLQSLAARAAAAHYRAEYRATEPAHGRQRARHAEWRVWHTPTALRVDVVTHGVTSTQISSPRGDYSCRRSARQEFCLLVATGGRHGHRLPALVATTLFSLDMRTLARHVDDYAVAAAAQPRCFTVRARAGAPAPRVARGTYCFTATGPVAHVDYATGSTVDAQHVSESTPPPSRFRPYSSPTPIP